MMLQTPIRTPVHRRERPPWSLTLSDERWHKVNELLRQGVAPAEVMRQCRIPQRNERSLRYYAERFGRTVRMRRYAILRHVLLDGALRMTNEFKEALQLTAVDAANPELNIGDRQSAVKLLVDYHRMLVRAMEADVKKKKIVVEQLDLILKREPSVAAMGIRRLYNAEISIDGGGNGRIGHG